MAVTSMAIMEWLQDKIVDSVEITNYCHTNFGKGQTAFIGIDMKDVPREERDIGDNQTKNDFPFISIVPLPNKTGDIANYEYPLAIEFGIKDDTKTELENKVTYEGLGNLEDFADFVRTILMNDLSEEKNVQNLMMNFHAEPIEEFPFYFGVLQVGINLPHYVGAEPIF